MSTTLVTRQTAGTGATVKGSPLTNTEVDTNFINLNNATQPAGGTAGQVLSKIDATNFNSQWIDNYATAVKLQVKNATGGTLAKGSVVYASGATGANLLVSLAKADAESTSSQVLGFLDSALNNGDSGLVVYTGTITGLDTSAYTEGDPVFLSPTTAGGIVVGLANKPYAPSHLVYLGTITRAHAVVGEIQVRVSNGWELSEIHDVQIISKADKDIIQYNSTAGVWKNIPATSVTVGSVSNSLTAGTGLSGTTFDGSAAATWTLATSGVTAGTYGSASSIPVITVDSYGRATTISSATVAGGQYFGSAAVKAIAYNSNSIGENVTVTAGNNGISSGPVSINNGFAVTVETGAVWVVI